MKKLMLVLSFCFSIAISYSQLPLQKKWDYRFGGDLSECLYVLQETKDAGYILAGCTYSDVSGDVTESSLGNGDFWIVKTDSLGIKQWDKRFGGDVSETVNDLQQLENGDYVLGGFTNSSLSGDLGEPSRGLADFWVIKIGQNGSKLWAKRFGGSMNEYITSLHQAIGGGYLLCGYSNSDAGGDVSQRAIGDIDFWVVKVDESGHKLWDKKYGGIGDDYLTCSVSTRDGGYLLAGWINSDTSIYITAPSFGASDYWIIKIDSLGNKEWDRRFGGNRGDRLYSVRKTNDGGYILGGFSSSDSSDNISQPSRGGFDYWIVKIDSSGNKEWDKRFGGDNEETGFGNVQQTIDGGYLLSGISVSNNSGDKTEDNSAYENVWVVKTDSLGNKQWDRTVVKDSHSDLSSYAIQSADGCYIIASYGRSGIGGDRTQASRGCDDFWFVKLCESPTTFNTVNKIDNASVSVIPNPTQGHVSLVISEEMIGSLLLISDIAGKKILSAQLVSINNPIEVDLPDGIYFVTISDCKQSITRKLMVEK
jgi:hypothetical protein